ncbi:MAG TPA: alcohol dehydrogenase catalytic domain-containing protein, partial [Verrucomicrobiae bacterium]|nr:alcohol dehydrogenase catalytic domain-containing protein [Verrucomicrobiae bacterium]
MSAMHAAVLRGPRDVRVEQRAQPSPGPGEAVVRVFASGLCGTDYRIWNGDRPVAYPRVMGHEFIGEVMAVGGDVTNVRPGQKVAVEPNYSCGHCALTLQSAGRVACDISQELAAQLPAIRAILAADLCTTYEGDP